MEDYLLFEASKPICRFHISSHQTYVFLHMGGLSHDDWRNLDKKRDRKIITLCRYDHFWLWQVRQAGLPNMDLIAEDNFFLQCFHFHKHQATYLSFLCRSVPSQIMTSALFLSLRPTTQAVLLFCSAGCYWELLCEVVLTSTLLHECRYL